MVKNIEKLKKTIEISQNGKNSETGENIQKC